MRIYGTDLVREVARSLVVYLKRAGGQSQFSTLVDGRTHPRSTRQLTRLFQAELGTTPARYVETVRIDVARAALDAGHPVAESARLAGIGSAETLRRVFVNHLGLSPKAYRDRFRTTSGG